MCPQRFWLAYHPILGWRHTEWGKTVVETRWRRDQAASTPLAEHGVLDGFATLGGINWPGAAKPPHPNPLPEGEGAGRRFTQPAIFAIRRSPAICCCKYVPVAKASSAEGSPVRT